MEGTSDQEPRKALGESFLSWITIGTVLPMRLTNQEIEGFHKHLIYQMLIHSDSVFFGSQ